MSDDDAFETRLRRALSTEAAMVNPAGDGLQRIRAGIDERSGRAWWKNPAVALAAAAVIGIAVGGIVWGTGGGDDLNAVPPAGSQSATPSDTAGTPTGSPSGSPSESVTSSAAVQADVYVYFIGRDAQGMRLYREQHRVTGTGSEAQLAVERMFRGQPDDPDYATPWDNTRLLSYSVSGDVATVDVDKVPDYSGEDGTVVAQELVYTVTANDKSVHQVQVTVNGSAPANADFAGPSARAPMTQVQGLIWVLAPKQGETVSSPVALSFYGTAFEGTLSWEIRKDGNVVKQGHGQVGSNGATFATYKTTVRLAPGEYEVTGFESSANDGSPIHVDTKTFTVQ